jgi:hypothetical protein
VTRCGRLLKRDAGENWVGGEAGVAGEALVEVEEEVAICEWDRKKKCGRESNALIP